MKTHMMARMLLFAALSVAGMTFAGESPPTYDLKVTFDIPGSRIIGTATVDAPKGAKLSLSRGDLVIVSLTTVGRRVMLDPEQPDPISFETDGRVQIEFEGIVRDKDVDTIGEGAIVLRDIWYPVVEGTYRYHLTATLPRDFVAVSEADTVQRTEAGGQATYSFDLPYPQRDWDGITFVASREWASRSGKYKDIDLTVHLHRRNAERLDEMMRDAQRYLRQHEEVLGPYPFKRLTIVENPVPITYSLSMFTYVLLSQRSVAAPVPEDSALNHEIAHEWFGNLVLADDEGGNWAEGLASYFSDHLENERLGRAWERRQRMMNVYQHNVGDRAAFPLSGFTAADDRNARLVGYAKSALVIHMLRRLVGDEAFLRAIRDFVTANRLRAASWTDIRHSFERTTGKDLGWFFKQWVDGIAMPELALEQVAAVATGDKHELRLTLTQQPPGSLLSVPLTVYFERGGSEVIDLKISGEREEFRFLLNGKPVRVVLDENYDVFRRLTPPEVPPMIDTLLTRQRVTLLAPPGEDAKFRALIDAFERYELPMALYGWIQDRPRKESAAASGTRFRPPPWVPPGTPSTRPELRAERAAAAAAQTTGTSLVLFGAEHPFIPALFGRVDLPRGGFTVTILKHPRSPGDVVAIFTATSKAEVDAGYRELINHPRYSSAAFNAGKLIWYDLRQGQRGILSEVGVERR
ncbi:MAG: hypothetical protein HY527_03160 [Betaproteobacteria bacterium]|nr:hypothetical protein [Betaproteobacteria bacterium]